MKYTNAAAITLVFLSPTFNEGGQNKVYSHQQVVAALRAYVPDVVEMTHFIVFVGEQPVGFSTFSLRAISVRNQDVYECKQDMTVYFPDARVINATAKSHVLATFEPVWTELVRTVALPSGHEQKKTETAKLTSQEINLTVQDETGLQTKTVPRPPEPLAFCTEGMSTHLNYKKLKKFVQRELNPQTGEAIEYLVDVEKTSEGLTKLTRSQRDREGKEYYILDESGKIVEQSSTTNPFVSRAVTKETYVKIKAMLIQQSRIDQQIKEK